MADQLKDDDVSIAPNLTVVQLHDGKPPLNDIPGRLRLLADQIENGQHDENGPIESCLVVLSQPVDAWPIMFGFGSIDGWNSPIVQLQLALNKWIHKIMVREDV